MRAFRKADEIRVATIGYGGAFNIAQHHLRQAAEAGMTPLAVADVDEGRLRVAARDFPGIETYQSVETLLKKSAANLIVLATPHNTHAALALKCLNAGRHVCTEKPMAITTAECDRMIAAAKKNRVMLTTYHNRHWDGIILTALDKIKRQKLIGEIVHVDICMAHYAKPGPQWRSSRSISGGILYDWGVHCIDYMLQLIDAEMIEVAGFAKTGFWAAQSTWKNDTKEDEAFAVVRFKSGQWATVRFSSIEAKKSEDWLTIVGTKGTYVCNGGIWKLHQTGEGEQVTRQGGNLKDNWIEFYHNLVAHLVHGKKLIITPQWSRRPIHLIDLAVQSAKLGAALKTKYG